MGISTVFQELSLIPQMTVADNIWLTREPLGPLGVVNRKDVSMPERKNLLALFAGTFKTELRPDMPVAELPPDEKQIIEILKAVSFNPRLLILDEATASLDSRQVQRLFELVTKWKAEGKAIVFVSHRMEEIFRIADRYSVLRNGKTVGAGKMNDITEKDLVKLMVDKDSVFSYRPRRIATEPLRNRICLEVQDLHSAVLRGVSFEVREGELVGIGGLQGQGQRDLLLSLFGDIPFTGTVLYNGKAVHFHHPRQAMKAGFALVPGDRAREGLLYIRSILENFQLPSWARYGFPLQIEQGQTGCRADGRAIEPENGQPAGAGQQPVGRQCPEGGHRQVADAPAGPAAAR